MKRVLNIYKENDVKLCVRTHAEKYKNFEEYMLSFRTDVWDNDIEDYKIIQYFCRKYKSEASMMKAFADLVNECLFDGSKFDLKVL